MAMVVTKRRRDRRRAVLVVGAVGAAVLIGATVWATSPDGHRAPPAPVAIPAVVPWIDEPASLAEPPAPSTPSPSPIRFAPCAADQMTTRLGRAGAAAGNESTPVVLTNSSTRGCSLSGYPTSVIGIRADGRRHLLAPQHGTMFDSMADVGRDLRPGQSTRLILATSSGCDAAGGPVAGVKSGYTGVTIGLPGGGRVSLPVQLNLACGLGVTRFGDAEPAPAVPVSAYPG